MSDVTALDKVGHHQPLLELVLESSVVGQVQQFVCAGGVGLLHRLEVVGEAHLDGDAGHAVEHLAYLSLGHPELRGEVVEV